MAAFDGRAFEGANGAVLYLQEKAPKTARLALASGVVVSEKGSRALLVSLVAAHGVGPDSALIESIRVAQEALDHWAVKGVMPGRWRPLMTSTSFGGRDPMARWHAESGPQRC